MTIMFLLCEGVMCSIDVDDNSLKIGGRRKERVFESFAHLFTHLTTLRNHCLSGIYTGNYSSKARSEEKLRMTLK